ncbi:MAG: SpoIIE family protein phosphatase, partial [Ruminococcus sp.]
STLTSKIISTMMASGLKLEDCVSTIAATLPICSQRGVAYSTFTIIHIKDNEYAEVIQYDNPNVIFIRDGEVSDYPKSEVYIGNKRILKSTIKLQEEDIFVVMSDGCPHAGIGIAYNFGWKWEDIADFMQTMASAGYSAKVLATMLVDQCNKEYAYKPGDDATACVIKIRKREPMNILFGPPRNPDDCNRMMSLFFAKEGKHIVCGGTTSSIVSNYLKKPIKASLNFSASGLPPTAEIEGVDLVTEGVITVNKVIEYAKDALDKNELYDEWSVNRDGASMICRLLFEEATDINFYVGRAVNPAHQNPDLPINFNIKMNLVEELSSCLTKMGKRIKVSYF